MSLQEVKENEERRKEIEIYRSNISNAYNMIKNDVKNLHNGDAPPLTATVMNHLKHVQKFWGILSGLILFHHMFQTDILNINKNKKFAHLCAFFIYVSNLN